MLKILKKLISFKTITKNHKENEKALGWIKTQIKDLPVYIKDFKSNGFSSLVITTQKTKKPIILLQAHLDVVEGPEKVFKPRIVKNRLYGRGAYDMKFAIACYLKLLKELNKDLSKYNFGIMITTDEEIGGFNGVKFLLDKGFKSKVCFLPDGGEEWKFEKEAKGVWHLLIESKGKSAHGSRPWLGKNAIENLISFLNVLRKEFPREPCHIKNHYHETLNIGKIQGGIAINKIPDSAFAWIDIRFTSKTNKSHLKKLLNSVKKNFKDIKIKEIVFGDNFKINPDNPYIQTFSQIALKRFKIKTSFVISHGSSDARFFVKKKIPVLLIKPKGGGQHSEKEWIDLKDLDRFYLVLKEFVTRVSK